MATRQKVRAHRLPFTQRQTSNMFKVLQVPSCFPECDWSKLSRGQNPACMSCTHSTPQSLALLSSLSVKISMFSTGAFIIPVKTPSFYLKLGLGCGRELCFDTLLSTKLASSLTHTYTLRRLCAAVSAVKHFYHGEKGVQVLRSG